MLYSLPLCLVQIKGADAERYLQGQMTCDVVGLAVGSHTLTAHCDALGKVQSLFRLYRADKNDFYALIPAEHLTHSLKHLQKYAIFSKVEFKHLNAHILGRFPTDMTYQRPDFCSNFSLFLPDGREILVCQVKPSFSFASDEQWQLADIKAGIPLLSLDKLGQFIPQALNLQYLEKALSFSKGCYIGQETIARAKYRGTNKRAMHVFYARTSVGSHTDTLFVQLGEHWRQTGNCLNVVQVAGELWLEVVLNGDISPKALYRLGDLPLTYYPLSYLISKEA